MSLFNTAAYVGINSDHVFLLPNTGQQYTEIRPFSPIRYSLCSNIPLARSTDKIVGARRRRPSFDNFDVAKTAHA